MHRPLEEGSIRTARIINYADGTWYAIITEEIVEKEELIITTNARIVAFDGGIKSLLVGSDGTTIPNQNFKKLQKGRLDQLEYLIFKKKSNSKRRQKLVRKRAKLHVKIANRRLDYLHKVSRFIVDTYSVIILEDLNLSKMVQRGSKIRLGAGLLDAALGYLYQLIIYKAAKAGKKVILVDCKYTSQDCNICDYRNILLTLNDREWECLGCGHSHNRDFNAALNILKRGYEALKKTGWEPPEAAKCREAPSIVSNGIAEVALGNRFEI